MNPDRFFILVGGFCGAAGVALSAMAAHSGGANISTAASFLLMHAPVFLALALLTGNRLTRLAGWVLAGAIVLFAGDLLAREFLGGRLFPFAAPIGGGALIVGWLVLAVSALVRTPPR